MELAGRRLTGKIVFAGVGNPERGDDGFGPALVHRLEERGWSSAIDCGDRLEDFTLDIARLAPDVIFVADAVEMNARRGNVAVLKISDLPSDCHTHALSVRRAMEYLRMRTGAEVLLLAVQPGETANGPGLSDEIEEAVSRLVPIILDHDQET